MWGISLGIPQAYTNGLIRHKGIQSHKMLTPEHLVYLKVNKIKRIRIEKGGLGPQNREVQRYQYRT